MYRLTCNRQLDSFVCKLYLQELLRKCCVQIVSVTATAQLFGYKLYLQWQLRSFCVQTVPVTVTAQLLGTDCIYKGHCAALGYKIYLKLRLRKLCVRIVPVRTTAQENVHMLKICKILIVGQFKFSCLVILTPIPLTLLRPCIFISPCFSLFSFHFSVYISFHYSVWIVSLLSRLS